jgi:hypothetical protein
MAEQHAAERPRREADCEAGKRGQGADERVRALREKQSYHSSALPTTDAKTIRRSDFLSTEPAGSPAASWWWVLAAENVRVLAIFVSSCTSVDALSVADVLDVSAVSCRARTGRV